MENLKMISYYLKKNQILELIMKKKRKTPDKENLIWIQLKNNNKCQISLRKMIFHHQPNRQWRTLRRNSLSQNKIMIQKRRSHFSKKITIEKTNLLSKKITIQKILMNSLSQRKIEMQKKSHFSKIMMHEKDNNNLDQDKLRKIYFSKLIKNHKSFSKKRKTLKKSNRLHHRNLDKIVEIFHKKKSLNLKRNKFQK